MNIVHLVVTAFCFSQFPLSLLQHDGHGIFIDLTLATLAQECEIVCGNRSAVGPHRCRAVAWAIIQRFVFAEGWVRYQKSRGRICKSKAALGHFRFPVLWPAGGSYHSTSAPYSYSTETDAVRCWMLTASPTKTQRQKLYSWNCDCTLLYVRREFDVCAKCA